MRCGRCLAKGGATGRKSLTIIGGEWRSIKKGNERDAFEYFQKAVRENPKDACSIMMMAEILYEQTEKYGDALRFVNAALERFPQKTRKDGLRH